MPHGPRETSLMKISRFGPARGARRYAARACGFNSSASVCESHASCGGHRQLNRHRHARPYRRCMRNPKPRNNSLYHISGGQVFLMAQSAWPQAGSPLHRQNFASSATLQRIQLTEGFLRAIVRKEKRAQARALC
jgi:hypothetical protein